MIKNLSHSINNLQSLSEVSSQVFNEDCVEGLKRFPDKFFDIAIVDPPYGIGNKLVDGGSKRNSKFDNNRYSVKWDILPTREYFEQLFRVSTNQIVWGANYFEMPPTRCNLIWDKMQEFNGADFELAWTSFDKPSKAFRMSRVEAYADGKIHPCQKPVKLYDWILKNYCACDNFILDTHVGSGSSRISCHKAGKKFIGFEINNEYYNKQERRFNDFISQLQIF